MSSHENPDVTKGPFPNRFSEFSNMTYSVSIYIQSPQHYKAMMNAKDGKKSVDGLTLLMQSGGISDSAQFGATRSKFFQNDFYIDDIQFKSLISGTSTSAAHNTFEVKFTVTEPMGLTFLENLNKSIQQYNIDLGIAEGDVNFISQTYLMVIRFYGYDVSGNQISGGDLATEPRTDIKASMEKFIPFMFTGITFRLESNKVVYSCQAVCPQTQLATDYIHGKIPHNVNLQGQDLKGVFTELTNTLNKHQDKLAKDGKYDLADKYVVEFQTDRLKQAKVVQPGTTLLSRTGFPSASAGALLTKDSQVNKTSRTYATNAGMDITTFLDLTVRSSSFISDQYKQTHDQNKTGTSVAKGDKDTGLIWFKINYRVEVIDYDKKRNNYAYQITYVISEYPIHSIDSSTYFKDKDCFDIHKEYNFWFTGDNTEVIDFNQDYNFLYYTSHGTKKAKNSDSEQPTNNAYQVNSREHGGEAGAGEEAANAASILYSPADQANAKIVIVGDPDWIAQSELFYPANGDRTPSLTMPDGSVNYDSSEIFFSINFNTVVDYSIETGLLDVAKQEVGQPAAAQVGGISRYRLVYRANTITTELSAGQFKQELEGTIKFIPKGCTLVQETREPEKKKTATEVGNTSNTDQKAEPPIRQQTNMEKLVAGDSTAGTTEKTAGE